MCTKLGNESIKNNLNNFAKTKKQTFSFFNKVKPDQKFAEFCNNLRLDLFTVTVKQCERSFDNIMYITHTILAQVQIKNQRAVKRLKAERIPKSV